MATASTPLPTLATNAGSALIYDVITIVLQTLFFGMYSVLMILSCRMLLKRGLQSRANRIMFITTLLTYFLSAAYWVYAFVAVVDRIAVFFDHPSNPNSLTDSHDTVTRWSPLFNAVLLINYIFSDAVVVWRAWVISWQNYRRYLFVTIVFFVLTTLCVAGVIVFRLITQIVAPYGPLPQSFNYLVEGIDILQISVFGLSLISNISATAAVGATAWRHRQTIYAAFADKKISRANQILTLMVESVDRVNFVIHSSAFWDAGYSAIRDIFTPISVQIAGAYPSVVLLLVSTQKPFLETFKGSIPGNRESKSGQAMQFGNLDFSGIETNKLGGGTQLRSDTNDEKYAGLDV
ncbi:hypothetical protein MSAN_00061200 [Mycena sanguinolenta]|uniref:Uncharacterized protein n=1 Tax=Mycena sanguinolenta TaxID=230812 RepID=A0A8H6ZGH4_9AGAR|nr:hypothetical protein MSAN_00061200 [Mycena sanguinolenta]